MLFCSPKAGTTSPARQRGRYFATLLIFFVCLSNYPAFGAGPILTNLVVSNTRDRLLFFLELRGAFSKKIKEVVLSGVPVTFSFDIALYQVRDFWPDSEITEKTVINRIKYDALRKEFSVRRAWESRKPVVVNSFDAARGLMTEINGLDLLPLIMLKEGRYYQIRIRATCRGKRHFVFWPSWGFKTDLYTIDFLY